MSDVALQKIIGETFDLALDVPEGVGTLENPYKMYLLNPDGTENDLNVFIEVVQKQTFPRRSVMCDLSIAPGHQVPLAKLVGRHTYFNCFIDWGSFVIGGVTVPLEKPMLFAVNIKGTSNEVLPVKLYITFHKAQSDSVAEPKAAVAKLVANIEENLNALKAYFK